MLCIMAKKKLTEPEFRNERICKGCNETFFDSFNLICLGTFDYCLKCTNQYVKKEEIERKLNQSEI